MTSLTWAQAAAWRAHRHHLNERAPREDALEVTSRLCGLHAQLMSSAELTLWARVEDLEPEAVAQALWEDRTLVKTWAMRGTLHLLPAAEYALWQAGLVTYDHYRKPAWSKAFGVSQSDLDVLIETVGSQLAGRELTREELALAVGGATSDDLAEKVRESWGAMLKPAAFNGKLVFAPNEGRNVRFTAPAQAPAALGEEGSRRALREIACRYVALNEPIAREDLARWWRGYSPAKAGRLLAELGEQVEEVELDGAAAYMLAGHGDRAAAVEAPRSVRLLPAFDQYVVAASGHADELLPKGTDRARVYRPQGWLTPVLSVDGLMRGLWRHERKGKGLVVEIEPLAKLPRWVREGAENEAELLAGFLGGDLQVSFAR